MVAMWRGVLRLRGGGAAMAAGGGGGARQSLPARGMDRTCSSEAAAAAGRALTADNVNPNIVRLEYAVRGPLVARATAIEKELQKGVKKPFSKVIKANIGDAHAMGQTPITFIRQVLACISYPELIKSGDFPQDVKQRATDILAACGGGSVGSYSASHGIESIRRHVSEYIADRDGFPSDWANVCLCGGASNGIKNVLQLLCNTVDGKPSDSSKKLIKLVSETASKLSYVFLKLCLYQISQRHERC